MHNGMLYVYIDSTKGRSEPIAIYAGPLTGHIRHYGRIGAVDRILARERSAQRERYRPTPDRNQNLPQRPRGPSARKNDKAARCSNDIVDTERRVSGLASMQRAAADPTA
jgi:hypothetical protein